MYLARYAAHAASSLARLNCRTEIIAREPAAARSQRGRKDRWSLDGVPRRASSRIRPVDDASERRLTRGAAQAREKSESRDEARRSRVIQTGRLNYARSEEEDQDGATTRILAGRN
jgi:hypothetical protein